LKRLAVDHRDGVVLLVGDEDRRGRGGRYGDGSKSRRESRGRRITRHGSSSPRAVLYLLNRHFVSGSSKPMVSVRNFWCRKPSCGEIDTSVRGPESRIGWRI